MGAEFVQAFIAGDVEKIYSFYADEAVCMPNYGPMIKGKADMIKQETEMRQAGFRVHSFSFKTMEVWSCGDMVYETGTFAISLTLPGMDNKVDDTGKYINIFQKGADGSLKIKYDMWRTDINPWMTDQPKGAAERDDK